MNDDADGAHPTQTTQRLRFYGHLMRIYAPHSEVVGDEG